MASEVRIHESPIPSPLSATWKGRHGGAVYLRDRAASFTCTDGPGFIHVHHGGLHAEGTTGFGIGARCSRKVPLANVACRVDEVVEGISAAAVRIGVPDAGRHDDEDDARTDDGPFTAITPCWASSRLPRLLCKVRRLAS